MSQGEAEVSSKESGSAVACTLARGAASSLVHLCVEFKDCVVDADRQEGGAGITVTILESHLERADFPNTRSKTPSCHNAASDLRVLWGRRQQIPIYSVHCTALDKDDKSLPLLCI